MQNNAKKIWLSGFIVLVLCMIALGGVTRLTRSGLSIVEWKPISGIIPPLTEQQWVDQFNLYKSSPEYLKVNSHFELGDYKKIFMWEYLHRVLGRLIFLYVLIPGLILWRRKQLEGNIVFNLATLVAAQGLIGWLMVKSGLNHEPRVSPFMLALHFLSALSVLLVAQYYLSKMWQKIFIKSSDGTELLIFRLSGFLMALQVFYGCLTSGWKAGFAYNTYPLMNGQFFPQEALLLEPLFLNFLKNSAAIQWTHRWLAVVVVVGFVFFVLSIHRKLEKSARGVLYHLLAVAFVQVVLGILNIIYVVPTFLGVAHQFVACLLILAYFKISFRLKFIS